MRRLILIIAAVGLIAAMPASAEPKGGGAEKCGKHVVNGSGWWKLKAKNVSCKNATKLADHFVFEAGGIDDRFQDWTCAKARVGDEIWTVQCSREKGTKKQEASFFYGA